MKKPKAWILPTVKEGKPTHMKEEEQPHREDYVPCPCCGYRTIPNHGDAIAYICPVCFWEIDVFLSGEEEPSDENHGLTLNEARKNFGRYGAVLQSLKPHCRMPTEGEKKWKERDV